MPQWRVGVRSSLARRCGLSYDVAPGVTSDHWSAGAGLSSERLVCIDPLSRGGCAASASGSEQSAASGSSPPLVRRSEWGRAVGDNGGDGAAHDGVRMAGERPGDGERRRADAGDRPRGERGPLLGTGSGCEIAPPCGQPARPAALSGSNGHPEPHGGRMPATRRNPPPTRHHAQQSHHQNPTLQTSYTRWLPVGRELVMRSSAHTFNHATRVGEAAPSARKGPGSGDQAGWR